MLADKAHLKAALRVALIKDRRDEEVFDEVFDHFFALVKVGRRRPGTATGTATRTSPTTGALEDFTLSEEPSETPQQGHSHGKPVDIRDFFDPEDLAQQYNLHQEANKIDLAAMTDEIVLSKDNQGVQGEGNRVQIETDRLSNAGAPGRSASSRARRSTPTCPSPSRRRCWAGSTTSRTSSATRAPRTTPRPCAAGSPASSKACPRRSSATWRRCSRWSSGSSSRASGPSRRVDRVGEHERMELEESLRRLAHSLHGGLTHKRRVAASGRIDSGRTMRRNMRFDGIPFSPVTVRRAEDKPRLVVLTDVSLSVRATARFTLHLVHGLQNLFGQVRTFAFVAELVEITDLFEDHPVEHALGLVFGGDVLDVDANSDYGAAFGAFREDFASAVTRRTTVLVLGDGRGNGNDPNLPAFEEITRRARETIWLTPEPRYSWGLGGCDLPAYAEYCSRVRVVRDLTGLESAATELATELVGR